MIARRAGGRCIASEHPKHTAVVSSCLLFSRYPVFNILHRFAWDTPSFVSKSAFPLSCVSVPEDRGTKRDAHHRFALLSRTIAELEGRRMR